MNNEKDQQYQQMRGEYIGLMASLEHTLTTLLVGYLNVQNYCDEFYKWFVEASIPFNYKASLLKSMLKDNTIIETNFPNFWADLTELQRFRNIIAHSFGTFGGMKTARDKEIPEKHVTSKALSEKLERLRKLENLVLGMLVTEYEGTIPPISADDFADSPL